MRIPPLLFLFFYSILFHLFIIFWPIPAANDQIHSKEENIYV